MKPSRTLLVAAASMMLVNPSMAQKLLSELTPCQTEAFYHAELLRSENKANYDVLRTEETNLMTTEAIVEKMLRDNHVTHKAEVPAYTPQAQEVEHPLTFIGMCHVAFYSNGSFYNPFGLYKFSTANGLVREPLADVNACINFGGAYVENSLHGYSDKPLPYTSRADGTVHYYAWDTDTWQPKEGSGKRALSIGTNASAYDPVTKQVYGFDHSTSQVYRSDFRAIDYDLQNYTSICETDTVVKCMAFNRHGVGYVLTDNKSLCTIDVHTGKFTHIGTIEQDLFFALQSMTFDDSTDKLYLCISTGSQENGITGNIFEVSTTDASTRLVGNLPEAEEYTCLRVLYTPSEGCPADVSDLKMQFEGETDKGTVSFTMPATNMAGQTISGTMEYVLEFDDDIYTQGTSTAGQAVSITVDGKGEGTHKAVVIISNETGKGNRNVTTAYAGLDTPMVHDLLFSVDEATNEATITWTADNGQNGGYVDVDNQTFRVVRYPGAVELATDLKECKYVESLSEMMYAGYYYEVTAVVNGEAGIPVNSNVIKMGKSYTIPYYEGIDQESSIDNFTVIDVNDDGSTWITYEIEENTGIYNYRLYYYRNVDNDADDWAILPPIHLNGGNAYELKFYASPVNASFEEILAVGIGENEEPSTYTTVMEPSYLEGGIRDMRAITVNLAIDHDGEYRIGFHAMSPKMQRAIFIDNISVVFKANLKAPAPATNLTVVPGEEGDLTATIAFDAPSTNLIGATLDRIDKVEIYRNGSHLVTTLTDVTPGQHVEYEDANAINGFSTYSIVAVNEFGNSTAVEATAYIGEDIPTEVTNLYPVDNLDGSITLHWDSPSPVGLNGGYVDAEALHYTVYSVTEEGMFNLGDCDDTQFKIEGLDQMQEQKLTYFAVNATNEIGSGDMIQTRLYVGKPYDLPFSENFANGKTKHAWFYTCNDYKGGFNMYSGMSVDGDNFVAAYQPYSLGTNSALHSGKISIEGIENPKVVFAFYNTPGRDNKLTATICPDGQAVTDTVFYRNFLENNDAEGWYYSVVDLAQYKDAQYVLLTFDAYVNDAKLDKVIIDDINVRDSKDYDLETSMTSQYHTTAGKELKIQTRVRNVGEKAAEQYSVNLYVNDRLEQSFEGEPLIINQYIDYELVYETKVSDPVQSNIRIEVAFEPDQNLTNNVAEQNNVQIATPLLNCVEDLALDVNDGNVELKWSDVSLTNQVTESFEGYDSFLIDGIGDWKVYDGDRKQNRSIIGLTYPHSSEAFAWITFDFDAVGVDLNANPQYAGQSGTQVIASQRSFFDYCDDWLISPALSGEAQTISFYARTMENIYPDKIRVLYSTTDNEVASFTNEVDLCLVDSEAFVLYELAIPEGATHFALYNPTDLGGFLQLDDITYTGKPLTLNGYKVYRDGECIATTTEPSYTDTIENSANHTYNVTALFVEGESGLSNDAYLVTGIDFVKEDQNATNRNYDLMGRQQQKAATGFSIQVKNDGTVVKVIKK